MLLCNISYFPVKVQNTLTIQVTQKQELDKEIKQDVWLIEIICISQQELLLLHFHFVRFSSLLCTLGANADKTCIGTCNTHRRENTEFLLIVSDHSCLLNSLSLEDGLDLSLQLCCQNKFRSLKKTKQALHTARRTCLLHLAILMPQTHD